MTGLVTKVLKDKGFGFIQANGKEHFFHRSEFNGHWDNLYHDHTAKHVEVEFDVVESTRGPRGTNVTRLDWPNQ